MRRDVAFWRLRNYDGLVRCELTYVDVTIAAHVFQQLINRTFGTAAAIPHPVVEVRRHRSEKWRKLSEDQKRRFWAHNRKEGD